ncbi:MAG TPA: response regulator transcription factor, partial [Solirubrobacteraceae bacterium]|nr:response regulator transcription factor [Solirubrobacteraceae bacterium]
MSTSDGIQTSSKSASGSDLETTVRVMVVDDQASFRRAARAVIDATPGFAPLRDAASGPEALEYADELQPDLVLMDASMPGMDGFEAARRLTAAHPTSVVVLVSIEDQDG